jgi:hypothetical protein
MKKIILHLCADTGSDTKPYQDDSAYKVILVGKDIGVENYHPPKNVHGIIANPVCTEFSTLRRHPKIRPSNPKAGMFLVKECQRIIKEANPVWWVIENPATGRLRDYLGKPQFSYQPWQFGSPWTKRTALWGKFNIPKPIYDQWDNVPKYPLPHVRPNRRPSLAFMHKSAYDWIPEFQTLPRPESDMELRSLCSQKFAKAFKDVNP